MTVPISLLIDITLKGTVVLAAAALAAGILRRSSAAQRFLIWQCALIAVLALPVVKAVSPWRLAVLPHVAAPVIAPPIAAPTQPVTLRPNVPADDRETSNLAPAFNGSQPTTAALLPLLLYWARFAWLAVAAALLLRLAFGFVLVRWYALRAYPLYEDGWAELNHELSTQLSLHSPARIYATPHVGTPMTWGFRRPVVMLPALAEDWSEERRRIVLLHELAHIRRRDSLTNLFGQLACACYWFHPLVWKAAARMRAEAERAADDLVLRTGTKASVYADHLLELVRSIGTARTPALALPMADRSTFEGRLLAILEPHIDRTTPRPLSVAGMIAAVALVVFPLAGLTTASALGTRLDAKVLDAKLLRGAEPAAPSTTAAPVVTADVPDKAEPTALVSSQQQPHTSVQALLPLLTDEDADVRLTAIESLGQLEDTTAVAALANALRNDADARVRKMAAWALGQIESRAAVPALTAALQNDKDVEVRRTSVWALGQIEDAAAVPALLQALRDADPEIRRSAVWALGEIEDKSAVPGLVQVLKADDPELRKEAVWALGQIESSDAVGALSALRNDPDEEVRAQVAWALGEIEDAAAVPALTAMLAQDKVAGIRKEAAWALGQIEARSATTALVNALKDGATEVRATAAWALGQIEDPTAVPGLRAAIKDADADVRDQALWALTQMRDEIGVEALAEMLKDPNPDVRRAAAAALGRHGNNPRPKPRPQPKPRPRPIN